MAIDSHVHFLDPSRAAIPWARGEMAITKVFGPAEYLEQAPAGTQFIHVEAGLNPSDRAAEAVAIAELALTWPALRAQVVADAPTLDSYGQYLDGPGMHTAAAVRVTASSLLRGLDARSGALLDRNLALELLFDTPLTPELAPTFKRLPHGLPVIIDHAANPPIAHGWDSREAREWAAALDVVAQRDKAVVKLSGMATRARDPHQWRHEVEPFAAHALATFGPARSMYGSDWPLCARADGAGPAEWLEFLFQLCPDSASFAEVSHGTCGRAYGLPADEGLDSPTEPPPHRGHA